MSFSKFFKLALLVVVALGIIGCSATPTRRSFKEGWKDSVVSTKVKYKLTADKLVKKRNIDVDAWRGVVTLTGRITSTEEKERAEQLAWQVKGVRGVDNFLKMVDGYTETNEAVATKNVKEQEIIDDLAIPGRETAGAKVVTKETSTQTAPKKVATKVTAPKKTTEPATAQKTATTTKNKTETPYVAEEVKTTTKIKETSTATRGEYEDLTTTDIKEKSISSEESLAKEAAEELKRLRGE